MCLLKIAVEVAILARAGRRVQLLEGDSQYMSKQSKAPVMPQEVDVYIAQCSGYHHDKIREATSF